MTSNWLWIIPESPDHYSCLDLMCRSRSRLRIMILPHTLHLYGDEDKCIPWWACNRMCLFKLLGSLNGRPQKRHCNGLCPVWVRKWIFNPYLRVYNLPQNTQICVLGSLVGSGLFSIRGLEVDSLLVGVRGQFVGLNDEILGLTLGVAVILSIPLQANAMCIFNGFGWLNDAPHWQQR